MTRKLFWLALSAAAWLAPASAFAATLWVNSATGSTCNGKTPCYSTIQAAIDRAGPGDSVSIQAGTYVEQIAISGKNAGPKAAERDRIYIEADPGAAVGSVVLVGKHKQCTLGHAIQIQRSKFVTIRGLTITGAGGAAISLLGGGSSNRSIRIRRNRIFANGSPSCRGGIVIARGNPETLLQSNLIYGNSRSGINFVDGSGGPHYLINNTIHRNAWNGIEIANGHQILIVNNLISSNGTARGTTGGRFGVKQEGNLRADAPKIGLRNNLLCANTAGEISGPVLDPSDSANLTPTGIEGRGTVATPDCLKPAAVYIFPPGADQQPRTVDDDFRLSPGSLGIDRGLDPRSLALPLIPDSVFLSDYASETGRPADGNSNGAPEFDIGAIERR